MRQKLVTVSARLLSLVYRYLWTGGMKGRFDRLIRDGVVTIGRHCYGIPSVHAFPGNHSKLVIGNYVSIAEEVSILLGGDHPPQWISTYPLRIKFGLEGAYEDGTPSSKGDVRIGSDVWIAHRVTILSGVFIGDGAIVAAGSVVIKDIPPYAIAGGVPAKVIRNRFDPPTVSALLAIGWWNWPDTQVKAAVSLLSSPQVGEFIRSFGMPATSNPPAATRPAPLETVATRCDLAQ
ncbi:MAG TPA: CatB-related O-acetyltransferase [Bryobacteraceae bacterium]